MTCPRTATIGRAFLNGVDDAELTAHAADCAACRSELIELQALGRSLGAVRAPAGLADAVMSRVGASPAPATVVARPARRRRTSRERRAAAVGAIVRPTVASAARLVMAGALVWATTTLLTPKVSDDPGSAGRPAGPGAAELLIATAQPHLELALPASLAPGDLIELPLQIAWAGGAAASIALEVDRSGGVTFEMPPPPRIEIGAGAVRSVPVRLRATEAGGASVAVRARVIRPPAPSEGESDDAASDEDEADADTVVTLSRDLTITPVAREVALATNVDLSGPLTRATVKLDPRVERLAPPRELRVRVLPGLVAEAELGLDGILRRPHGCFEQTTAGTFPALLVLELAASGASIPPRVLERATRNAIAGAARLARFQHDDGGFSLHPHLPTDPWLTARGLRQLAAIERLTVRTDGQPATSLGEAAGWRSQPPGAIEGADPIVTDSPIGDRIAAATDALLRWRTNDGDWSGSRFVRRPAPELALTAAALEALLGAGVAADEPRVAASLDRIESRAAAESVATYDLVLAARATALVPERAEATAAFAARLLARGRRDEHGLSWSLGGREKALNGSGGLTAGIELGGHAAVVLAATGNLDDAAAAVRWIAAHRDGRGFRGTQSTVAALEGFRVVHRSGSSEADGRLRIQLGRDEPPTSFPIVRGDAGLLDLPIGTIDGDDPVATALAGGVTLTFEGEGRLRAQVVVTGYADADDRELLAAAAGARLAAPQLRVQTSTPETLRVGEVARFAVIVSNESQDRVDFPMVELDLPPGAEPATVDGVADGGLGALVRGDRLRFAETNATGVVLYLHDLAPGATERFEVAIVATAAGEMVPRMARAYPYYAPEGEVATVAARPLLVTTAPAPSGAGRSEPEPARGPADRLPPRRGSTGSGTGTGTGTGTGDDSGAARERERRGDLVIAWDAALSPTVPGPLTGDQPPPAAMHGARLLGRALLLGIPDVSDHRDTGQGVEFTLRADAFCSDGSLVALDDFLQAWRVPTEASWSTSDPWTDPTQMGLFRIRNPRTTGLSQVVIQSLPDDDDIVARLRAHPYLPIPMREVSGEGPTMVTNGLYQVAQQTPDTLVLHRTNARPELGGPTRVLIHAQPILPTTRDEVDLIFTIPAPDSAEATPLRYVVLGTPDRGQGDASRSLVKAAISTTFAHQEELARELGWILPREVREHGTAKRRGGALVVGYEHRGMRDTATAIVTRLIGSRIDARLHPEPTPFTSADESPADIIVGVAEIENGRMVRTKGLKTVPIGVIPVTVLPGRRALSPRSVDRNGWLVHPIETIDLRKRRR